MHWHAEVTFRLELLTGPGAWLRVQKLTLRGYLEPGGYEEHRPFDAVAQADVYSEDRRAFIHAAMRRDGAPLGRADWRDLARLLNADFGVETAVADRHGREVVLPASRWAPKTIT